MKKRVLVLIGLGLISSGAHAKVTSYHDKNMEWNQKWEKAKSALPSNQVEGVTLQYWRSLSDLTDSKNQSALSPTINPKTHPLKEDQSSQNSPKRLSWFSGWLSKAPEFQPQKKKRLTLSDISAATEHKTESSKTSNTPQTLREVFEECKKQFHTLHSSFHTLQNNLYVQWMNYEKSLVQLREMINQNYETARSTENATDLKGQLKHTGGLSEFLSNVKRAAEGLKKQFDIVPQQLSLRDQQSFPEATPPFYPQKSSLISTVQTMLSKGFQQLKSIGFKSFLFG